MTDAGQRTERTLDRDPQRKTREVDMLHGGIFKKLLYIALPIALSSILQQLFNASDSAVVGRFSSSEAMAAVGSNAPIINIIVTFFSGLSVGSNVMLSSFIGSGEKDRVNDALHTSFTVALVSGMVILGLGQLIAVPILSLLNTPDEIMTMASAYLRIYFLGMPFLMIYDFGSAILRSIGDTRRPLIYLTFSGALNVALNLFFVVVLGRNADGVAIATTISNGVSAFLIVRALVREKGMLHLDLHKLGIRGKYLRRIFYIGAPAGLQGMVFSLSNIVIQGAINSFGSACIAGNTAAQNFEYMCYFIINGFAQAEMTFISQNYAAHNFDRCRRTNRICFASAIGITALVSTTFLLLRYPLLSIFTGDPEVVAFGVTRFFFIVWLEPMTGLYEIPGASLRGIGHSFMPMLLTLFGSCLLRLIYIGFMTGRFTAFWQVTMIYPISWAVTGTMVIILYLLVTREVYHR